MPDTDTHVIIGAGLAGAKAAEALRNEGFDGQIVLVGQEPELPYERPPLSKDYLRGESARDKARVHPEDFYAANDIDLRTATVVEGIDVGAREVALSTGKPIHYDRLLIATGAEPRRLAVPGAELEGVHYLRDFSDADKIAAHLDAGRHMVVIGAGWIGSEVAASARQKGVEVTVIEQGEVPLERVLGRQVGEVYAQLHRDHGVELLTGISLASIEGAGRVERVRLSDGHTVASDVVVAGIGVTPRTALAERAGITLDNGIVTDERLETSAAGVFATGDVANAFHPFYGHRLRVEHWANALHQPAVAARAMLGKPTSYERLPYFFSDQYEVGMEYSGYARSWQEVVFRGDLADREFIAFWLERGRVVAGMNVNVWDVTDPIQRLIRSHRSVQAAQLRDPELPLEDLANDGRELDPAA
jgi:3-phenylpropionate/trans-cinnamate dioxygenase ferredoxin reductase subunit